VSKSFGSEEAPLVKAPPIERWFVRRGVPHFISNYSATEDVWTRAIPALIIVFLLSSVSGIDLNWTVWQVAAASFGGLLVLLGSWMALNRYRNQPVFEVPRRVGWPEIALLILVPTALPLIFGGDWVGAIVVLTSQVILLGLIFVLTSYGLVAISLWAIGRLFRTLGQTLRLFTRSLPLLLIGFMFLFINAEAWQSAGELDPALLWTVVGGFGAFAGIFLATQIPKELRAIETFDSPADVIEAADDAPVSCPDPLAEMTDPPGLSAKEKGNLWLVAFITQSLRLLLVSVLIGLVFVAIGLVLIRPETIQTWTNRPPDIWWDPPWELFGNSIAITTQLLQVSVFLAAFAAVYFSVYATTDPMLRADFFEDTISEIRQNLAARAIYRANLRHKPPEEPRRPPT